jgi:DNA (cytosine-5)-methyltransferase 1
MHYKYHRVISVRESARIQSFPDSFVWPVGTSPLQQYQQVGNAVFPLLASALGPHLAEAAGFNLDPERYGIEPEPRAGVAAPDESDAGLAPLRSLPDHCDPDARADAGARRPLTPGAVPAAASITKP